MQSGNNKVATQSREGMEDQLRKDNVRYVAMLVNISIALLMQSLESHLQALPPQAITEIEGNIIPSLTIIRGELNQLIEVLKQQENEKAE